METENGLEARVRIENWLGIGAVALLGLGCVVILLPFISAALWAAILCFASWPLFVRLKVVSGGRRTLTASLATLVLSAIIVAPVAVLASELSSNMTEIIAATQELIHEGPPALPAWVASIPLVGGHFATPKGTFVESRFVFSIRKVEVASKAETEKIAIL